VVLVAATAHRREWRDAARVECARFIEVHVATPVEVCARRDPKGLYARAAAGEAIALPGASVEYEPPAAPEVTATGGDDPAAVAQVLGLL
jgi:adenylylsulfate kinase